MKKNTLFLSPNARLVLKKRYLKKDASGNPFESPEDMFHRIAENAASADLIYNKEPILSLLKNGFTILWLRCNSYQTHPH